MPLTRCYKVMIMSFVELDNLLFSRFIFSQTNHSLAHLSNVIFYSFSFLSLLVWVMPSEVWTFLSSFNLVSNKWSISQWIPYSYINSMFFFLCWILLVVHRKCRILLLRLRCRMFSLWWFNYLIFAVRRPLEYLFIT